MSLPSHEEVNRSPIRRWVASPWGALLLLGVLVILIAGSLKLVHRYTPEERLRSYVPGSIRGTCDPESHTYPVDVPKVATEDNPSAIAGLICYWKGVVVSGSNAVESSVWITYLLFGDREALLGVYPVRPTNCFTDEAGRRICYGKNYFGTSRGIPYDHLVLTDGTLFLTDATVVRLLYG